MVTIDVLTPFSALQKSTRFISLVSKPGGTLNDIFTDESGGWYTLVRSSLTSDVLLVSAKEIKVYPDKVVSPLLNQIEKRLGRLKLEKNEVGKYRIAGEDLTGYTGQLPKHISRRMELSSFADVLYATLIAKENIDSGSLIKLISAMAPRLLAKWEFEIYEEKCARWDKQKATKMKSLSSSPSTTPVSND